ncbi:MAG: EAL domain-containing protein [Acaryochloridaceae cyanobacterium SU_2_1]|nr:EAL domain-containing protein [Acaryochloridaceae cyanobacterium SU_2_1]
MQERGDQWWSVRIKQAIEEKRLRLYGQTIFPTVEAADTNNNACEILLRMTDEQNQVIPAGEFIPAAERYNLISQIDRWVIHAFLKNFDADRQTSKHQSAQPTQYMINLSGASVGDEQFLEFLKTQLEQHPKAAQCICFGITETAAISSWSQAVRFIQELRALGCQFALDDFGSGMSSFAYLKTLPVDYLKIDGRFIEGMTEDPTKFAIVESINHIGHVMGMQTIAECVSSITTREKLQDIGVDYVQGFEISQPFALQWS